MADGELIAFFLYDSIIVVLLCFAKQVKEENKQTILRHFYLASNLQLLASISKITGSNPVIFVVFAGKITKKSFDKAALMCYNIRSYTLNFMYARSKIC